MTHQPSLSRMPETSTDALRRSHDQAKAECARLGEALRSFDPASSDTTEAELKVQLVKALLRLEALSAQLDTNTTATT